MKHKKHENLVNDFEKQKQNHLEKLGTKLIKGQEKFSKLKEKDLKTDFLKLF